MPVAAMLHEIDPREVILKRVGALEGVDVFGTDVLVAIYERPTKTKSGIYMPETTVGEDKYQGKAMLVLKMGPTCFLDEDGKSFRDIAVGDWVVIRPSDGWALTLNTMHSGVSVRDTVNCRIVSDIAIRARVAHPDLVY